MKPFHVLYLGESASGILGPSPSPQTCGVEARCAKKGFPAPGLQVREHGICSWPGARQRTAAFPLVLGEDVSSELYLGPVAEWIVPQTHFLLEVSFRNIRVWTAAILCLNLPSYRA